MPYEKMYLLFGLLSAVLYAVAASSLKTAADKGVSTLRTTLLANIVTALAFLIFVPWREGNILPDVWWPSVIEGLLFFAGQFTAFLALSRGHASVATPVLGSKAVMVALILWLGVGRVLGANIWIAAVLTMIGIAVLAISRSGLPHKGMGQALFYSLLAAFSFAMFDVMTAVWSPKLGFGRFMPLAMVIAMLVSIPPVLMKENKWGILTKSSIGYLAMGVGLMTLQSLILIWAIGTYRDAAGLNIVYVSRGIWSVLLVWIFGHLFTHHERMTSGGMVVRRLAAACIIAVAVVLVFWK